MTRVCHVTMVRTDDPIGNRTDDEGTDVSGTGGRVVRGPGATTSGR